MPFLFESVFVIVIIGLFLAWCVGNPYNATLWRHFCSPCRHWRSRTSETNEIRLLDSQGQGSSKRQFLRTVVKPVVGQRDKSATKEADLAITNEAWTLLPTAAGAEMSLAAIVKNP